MNTISVALTETELLFLDGKVSLEVQNKIDSLKNKFVLRNQHLNVDSSIVDFISEILEVATRTKKISYDEVKVRLCVVCKESRGYKKRERTTKNYRKGDFDYSQPLYWQGVDLVQGFIRLMGVPALGCCDKCWEKIKPLLIEELNKKNIKAEIHQKITGVESKFKRYPIMVCSKCNWQGGEHQLLDLPAIMGGRYKGECPNCHAMNTFLEIKIKEKIPVEYVLVENLK